MANEKTIKQFVDEFKDAFGRVEFKATDNATGQVGGSKNWQESKPAAFEITGDDYLALGNLTKRAPAQGVIANLLNLELKQNGKRK